MNKTLLTLMRMALPTMACADGNLTDQLFAKTAITLTPQERAALTIGQKWQTGSATSMPVAGSDGSIRYVYGSGQLQIVCAVLQVCDISLQAGEQFNNLNVGDPRFHVEPAITGSGDSQTIHLLVKPTDVNLDTSVVVTTDRRTYHFRMRSTRSEFMPYVSFIYPEDAMAKWEAIRNRDAKRREDTTLASTGESIDDLDFNYTVSGSASWKPVRVYAKGPKTIIEMPASISKGEAPVLAVIGKEGGIFKDAEPIAVNYRFVDHKYIVDGLFEKAYLMLGVGSDQERVTITKGS